MKSSFDKLTGLLKKLFQLDQADLDFGIYRIMNTKRDEITRFLENDLLPQVQEAFQEYQSGDKSQVEVELQEAIQRAESLGADPDTLPKVKELREKLNSAVDVAALENEVYSHLYSFFQRYYHEGDFLSLRRYKKDVYAIPYEGEEVTLYWANHDQYYIKSSEYLRDYTFMLPSEKKVHFKLAEADTEKDNVKAVNGKERRFILAESDPIAEEDGELYIRFEYRPEGNEKTQKDLNADTSQTILNTTGFADWQTELGQLKPTESNPNRTLLDKHLADYTARNTFDYFIHKDLGGFLRRELDFYIKNEVMYLDDIEEESAPKVEQYLSKIKVIRKIAHKIIAFLEQLENFQKKLWLKKKFVVETNYCVTLDRVPEELYPEIAANDAQRKEWVKLFAIDEIKGDMLKPAYSDTLTTEFLKDNPFLLLDTAFFSDNFKNRLIASMNDIDSNCDGLLIYAENFQALNLVKARYREKVKCIYIDPPYNTSTSQILYKNDYKHSSWLSLIDNTLAISKTFLLRDCGVLCGTIDDVEHKVFGLLIENYYGNLAGSVSIRIKPSGRPIPNGFALSHEYAVFAKTNADYPIARLGHTDTQKSRYRETDEKGAFFWEMFRKAGSNSNRYNRPTMYYPFYREEKTGKLRLPKMEYDDKKQEYVILDAPKSNEIAIYPVKDDGSDGCWYFGVERAKTIESEFKAQPQDDGNYRIYYRRRPNIGVQPTTLWSESKYSATEHGTALLKAIFGEQGKFDYPKSIHAVVDCLTVSGVNDFFNSVVLDYFAGSGTTGHAVINLNREDSGNRKYILVEMGEYFNTVLKPRIQKVVYSTDWKDGKPVLRDGISHMFKYMRLESYEDALNNLQLKRTEAQQLLLDSSHVFRESYVLSYMLDVESNGSASLLNIDQFEDPFNYKLNIATSSVGETKPTVVDLVETFNYLVGLTVNHIDTIRGFQVVQGTNPKGEKVLIIWRNLKEKSNEDLEGFFRKQEYNPRDMEFDLIYVNGDNNLENIRRDEENWKVRLIEEEFKRLMFDVQDV